jgi:hypothetical protein
MEGVRSGSGREEGEEGRSGEEKGLVSPHRVAAWVQSLEIIGS